MYRKRFERMRTKTCRACGMDLPIEEFYLSTRGRSVGYRSQCATCVIERQKIRNLMSKYGLTPERFEQMVADQGGVCAICDEPPAQGSSLYVDHDHATGDVRGLLCRQCNAGIGMLKDDAAIVRRAADYMANAPKPLANP